MSIKTKLARLLMTVVATMVVGACAAQSSLNLEVRAFNRYGFSAFQIENVGTGPIKILDLMVNERDDCSAKMTGTTTDPVTGAASMQFGSTVRAIQIPHTAEEMHQMWVHHYSTQRFIRHSMSATTFFGRHPVISCA